MRIVLAVAFLHLLCAGPLGRAGQLKEFTPRGIEDLRSELAKFGGQVSHVAPLGMSDSRKWSIDVSRTRITDSDLKAIRTFGPSGWRLSGDDRVDLLNSLNASKTDLSDKALLHLRGIETFREISVAHSNITEKGVCEIVKDNPFLVYLDLSGLSISSKALTGISERKMLRTLLLRGTRIDDEAGEHLRKSERLCEVDLSFTSVTDKTISATLAKMERLERIGLAGTPITDHGMKDLEKLGELRALDISGTGIGDKGIGHLHALAKLRTIDIRQTLVTNRGVTSLQKALPNLRIIAEAEK